MPTKKYDVKIDNKEISVKDGFVLKEELNETLDSGTIVFLSEDGEANIDPFDSVVFEGTQIERKKLLVDTYNAEIENFKDTLETSDYLYTINLFSETKLLERITLPNLTITKRPDGTIVSVFDKIKEYCKRYLPYIKVYDEDNRYTYKASLRYDEALETKFAMECPEFVWNTPTLKEVLMDLFSVADCIPVVKDNVLTFFDLTYKGNPIDTTKLTNKTVSKTSADYCDQLTLPMKNIISKQPVIVKEHLLPHSTGGEMTSNNAVYITRKPIYKIKKAIYYIYYKDTFYGNLVLLDKIDITNHIVEKKNWETYGNGQVVNRSNYQKNRAFNLHFERGGNLIEGIGDGYKLRLPGDAIKQSYSTHALLGWYTSNSSIIAHADGDGSWGSATIGYMEYGFDAPFIELEYETIEETVVNVSKTDEIKNKQNALFDSQSANSVDLEHQTLFEYAKANRLSSKIEQIEGVYNNESDIPQLGDYIGNKILFSKEVSYYDDIYLFRGQLCENYILRNYFTGITSKRRSWNIVDTNDAVLRQDYYKFFILYSTQNNIFGDKYNGLPYHLTNFSNTIFEKFTDYGTSNFYVASIIKTTDKNGTGYPSSTSKYGITDLMIYEIGKSLVFSANQDDNFSFGDSVEKEDNMFVMNPNAYTDANGEFTQFKITFRNNINEMQEKSKDTETVIAQLLNASTFNKNNLDELLEQFRKNPVIYDVYSSSSAYLTLTSNFTKDNREIIGSSVQFEYLSADKNVIVNEDVSKIMRAGHRTLNSSSADLGVKVISNYYYKQGETTPLGNDASLSFSFTSERIDGYKIVLNETIGENDAWCLYSKITGKILIAVNGTNQFYCNLCYTRDLNVYNSQVDKIAIGNYGDTQATLDENYSEQEPSVSEIKVLNRIIDISDTKEF